MKIAISALYQELPNFFLKESCGKYLGFVGSRPLTITQLFKYSTKAAVDTTLNKQAWLCSSEWALISYNCHFEIFSQLKM